MFAVLRFIKRGEEKIVEGFFPLLDFLFCEARATDLSFILCREFGIALIEMDTLEAVFVFEIKMVVNDNLLSVVVGQELQQSFGTNTVDCMKSGTVFGTAAMLDGLTARMERDFGKEVKTTVATGGLAEEIVKNCERRIVFDRDLILEGLKNIFNRKEQ